MYQSEYVFSKSKLVRLSTKSIRSSGLTFKHHDIHSYSPPSFPSFFYFVSVLHPERHTIAADQPAFNGRRPAASGRGRCSPACSECRHIIRYAVYSTSTVQYCTVVRPVRDRARLRVRVSMRALMTTMRIPSYSYRTVPRYMLRIIRCMPASSAASSCCIADVTSTSSSFEPQHSRPVWPHASSMLPVQYSYESYFVAA